MPTGNYIYLSSGAAAFDCGCIRHLDGKYSFCTKHSLENKKQWNSNENYNNEVRQFETGAIRDSEEGKPDYEAFLSPLVTKRFGKYMHKHRVQTDGKLREGDNWQKGMTKDAYIKSLVRHVEDLKLHHDGFGEEAVEELQDSLCAIIFNANGYLFEVIMEGKGNR